MMLYVQSCRFIHRFYPRTQDVYGRSSTVLHVQTDSGSQKAFEEQGLTPHPSTEWMALSVPLLGKYVVHMLLEQ